MAEKLTPEQLADLTYSPSPFGGDATCFDCATPVMDEHPGWCRVNKFLAHIRVRDARIEELESALATERERAELLEKIIKEYAYTHDSQYDTDDGCGCDVCQWAEKVLSGRAKIDRM